MKSSISNLLWETMDERSRELFKRIVEFYFQDGESTGSKRLADSLPYSLSSATIRYVMRDLEKMGLIYAPHTSSGRIPTQLGLRLFIDIFIKLNTLSKEERKSIATKINKAGKARTVEQFLSKASETLSSLSRGVGLIWAVKNKELLKHIEFVQLDSERILIILVMQGGDVETKILALPPNINKTHFVCAANYLNEVILAYQDARDQDEKVISATLPPDLDEGSGWLIHVGLEAWNSTKTNQAGQLIVYGRANLLDYFHIQEDLEQLRRLFDDLETNDMMLQLLKSAKAEQGIQIFIGSENQLFSLSGSSLVVAPYRNAAQRVIGALGIIGPKWLNYARIVPMVDYTAHLISQRLP